MAYAAVVSLKHTIHRLLKFSIGFSSQELLESAYVEVESLQQVLKRLDDSSRRSKRLNELDGEIREALHKFEDTLEFHESNMFLQEIHDDLELEEVRKEINIIKEEFVKELDRQRMTEEEEEDEDYQDFGVEMVGVFHDVRGIKKKLLQSKRPDDCGVFSIVGRPGSGRTVVARNIFQDLCVGQERCLDCGAFVKVGQKYEWKEILLAIHHQVGDPAASPLLSAILRQVGDPAPCDTGLITIPDRPSEKIEFSSKTSPLLSAIHRQVGDPAACDTGLITTPDRPSEKIEFSSKTSPLLSAIHRQVGDPAACDTGLISTPDRPSEKIEFSSKTSPLLSAIHRQVGDPAACDTGLITTPDRPSEKIEFSSKTSPLLSAIHRQVGDPAACDTGLITTPDRPSEKIEFSSKTSPLLSAIHRQVGDPAACDTGLITTPDRPSEKIKTAEEFLVEHLYRRLKGRRYMIVLDDVCDTKVWDYLKRSFPKQDNGSLVLLTTSLEEVALSSYSFHIYRMPEFVEDPMWDFLCLVIYGGPFCPPELEEVGKKIVKNCQRLTLVSIKVLLFLSKTKKTPELWKNIAADEDNPIFMVADEIPEVCRFKEDLLISVPDDDQRACTFLMVANTLKFSSLTDGIKMQMFPKRLHPKMEIYSICGMAGLGKTAMVKKVFEDPQILNHFDRHAWITLGPKYQSEELLVDILAKMYHVDKMHLREDENLVKDLCTQLSNKRCLIVLDDLWNKEPLHYLQKLLPDIKGEIFVTTRLFEVAKCGVSDFVYKPPLLDEKESWLLFCRKVFASELCPLKLEKVGKRICKNCEGLPLLILTVADLLSKAEISQEFWEEVAKKKNSIFMEAQALMSNVLSPSYKYLPQHLKAFFLYMGVFSQNYEVPTSRLIKMWNAEGFLEPNPPQTVKEFSMNCLTELVDKSLVMVCQKSFQVKIKTCRLHSVFWHLSNDEAVKNKFFLTLSIDAHNAMEGKEAYRRLCIRSGVLFSIKDLQDSIMSLPSIHSLLYTGPRHQYPVPLSVSTRLLRVLDALMIRFYEFPSELVTLIQLTYLALTCNEELPSSISKLRKLQYLIVSQHLSIKSEENSSYLPAEIWDMKELNHLQIMGGWLRNPRFGSILPKLSTLLEVDAQSCTKKVLKRLPNLKKLGIQIELAPDNNGGKSFRCLNRISRLRRLESLKCVVVNPDLMSEVVSPPAPRSMFPSGLKKLSLCGLGYPWEYMSIIGELKNLEVLKLRCYAFQGPLWETNYRDFRKLKYLLIEDTDLVCWKLTVRSCVFLEHISIKHCYNFEELPNTVTSIKMIEVDDCNSVVMSWAEQLKEKSAWTVFGREDRRNQITCSWDSGNFKQ